MYLKKNEKKIEAKIDVGFKAILIHLQVDW